MTAIQLGKTPPIWFKESVMTASLKKFQNTQHLAVETLDLARSVGWIALIVIATIGSAVAGEDDILGPPSTENLPVVTDGRFIIPEIKAVSTSTESIGNGSTPEGVRADAPRPLSRLPELASDRAAMGQFSPAGVQESGIDSSWNWSVTHWAAANTFSNPRYFEDVMLERHGHQRWGHLQPIASGMRFFTTIPMLPYKMAIKPPCECEYTMGYYRTGSCAPGLFQRPPWDRKAILAESAAVATGMLILP